MHKTSTYQSEHLNNQDGKAVSWVILFISIFWGAYFLFFENIIRTKLSSNSVSMIQITLLVLSVTLIFLSLLSGDNNRKQTKISQDFAKKLETYNKRILQLIQENEKILNLLTEEMQLSQANITKVQEGNIKAAEAIINDLKFRHNRVNKNIASKSNANLIAADTLIRQKTITKDQLITKAKYIDPNEALDEASLKLKRIFKEIQIEQKSKSSHKNKIIIVDN